MMQQAEKPTLRKAKANEAEKEAALQSEEDVLNDEEDAPQEAPDRPYLVLQ